MTVGGSHTNGFLFADLRDYTRYVESYGDRAAAELLDAYRRLVRATVGQFGGAEVKTEGDSFYVVFPSASSAVQCGLAILREATESRAQGGEPIRVGIGVHAGETVETAEGYVGSAVNIAARVCSQARAGELLVTDTVRSLTRTMLPVRFVGRRVRRLKGIAEPMTLYRVESADAANIALAPRRSGLGRLTDVVAARDGLRHVLRLAAVLVLLVVGAAGAYVLLGFVQDGLDAERGDVTSTSTPPAMATGPSAEEADLLVQVPIEIQEACAPTTDRADSLGGIAVVRCELPAGEEADVLWYERFSARAQLETALTELGRRQNLPDGECAADRSRAQGPWTVGSTFSGRLFCYQEDGQSWVVWSYDVERIVARAMRAGASTEDWTDLYEWWSETRLFLR